MVVRTPLSGRPQHHGATVTPDGERLVMVSPVDRTDGGDAAHPQIVTVQNSKEELKRLVPMPHTSRGAPQ